MTLGLTRSNSSRRGSQNEPKASSDNQETLNGKFEDEDLSSLPFSSAEELQKHEILLQKEFEQLSEEYIVARKSRINHLLTSLNHYIKIFSENDKNWTKIFNFELETIKSIKINTENLILSKLKLSNPIDIIENLDEYELELNELFNNIQSPLDFDDIFKVNSSKSKEIPFEKNFKNFFKPFEKHLKSVSNENNYQTNLIKSNVRGNQMILWKQYYNHALSQKEKLINETYNELHQLYKEFNHMDEYQQIEKDWKAYNKSIVGINNLKPSSEYQSNHDIYYDVDNPYFRKNKIELTNIKQTILNDLNKFNNQQRNHGSDNSTILNSCFGLSWNEIDQDLLSIRSLSNNKDVAITQVNAEEDAEEEIYDEDEYDYDDDDDEEEEESEDDDEYEDDASQLTEREVALVRQLDREEEEKLAKEQYEKELDSKLDEELSPNDLMDRKYKQLLSINKTQSTISTSPPFLQNSYSYGHQNNQYSTPPSTSSQYIEEGNTRKRRFVLPEIPPLGKFPRLEA